MIFLVFLQGSFNEEYNWVVLKAFFSCLTIKSQCISEQCLRHLFKLK